MLCTGEVLGYNMSQKLNIFTWVVSWFTLNKPQSFSFHMFLNSLVKSLYQIRKHEALPPCSVHIVEISWFLLLIYNYPNMMEYKNTELKNRGRLSYLTCRQSKVIGNSVNLILENIWWRFSQVFGQFPEPQKVDVYTLS